MIIIINGTLGIGKTWIARCLMSQLDEAAYIEGDVLGFVSPALFSGQSRQQFALEIGIELISAFRRKGAKIIVYDCVFVDPAVLKEFSAKAGIPIKLFYLSASAETVSDRIKKRARPQVEKELVDAVEVERLQRVSFKENDIGIDVNTDGKNPEEIVAVILNHLN